MDQGFRRPVVICTRPVVVRITWMWMVSEAAVSARTWCALDVSLSARAFFFCPLVHLGRESWGWGVGRRGETGRGGQWLYAIAPVPPRASETEKKL